MRRKFTFGLAAIFVACASVLFAAPAAADSQPDPQLSNVPYLAWRGEEVRLVKCEPGLPEFDDADFLLVDWSGDPHLIAPQLEPGTVSFFSRSWDGAPCVAAEFTSSKAGLAQIKLVVSSGGTVVLKHDFIVIWMNISSNTLTSLDPTTDTAGGPGNELQVLIKGSFPLMQNYTELGIGDSLTMPDDWATLARAIAVSRGPLDPDPAQLWDIHDEFSPTSSPTDPPDDHGAQSACPVHDTTARFDTVDNCTGEPFVLPVPEGANPANDFEVGFFSRIWSGFTAPTLGPFDPQRAGQTLLSNGILDSGDAPMPAARIDFAIAPNVGGIEGVGSFAEVDKHVVYSRDGTGAGTPHNLYGPFYARWIPATAPALINFLFTAAPPPFPLPPGAEDILVPEASGVSGPANVDRASCGKGNNFNGYLNQCAYHFWDISAILQCGPTGSLEVNQFGQAVCVPTSATPIDPTCPPFVNDPQEPLTGIDQPFLAQRVVVYTDEHGEARIRFLPGTEFFFNNLPGLIRNANGGCDIAGVSTLGTADITATARYPFQPVTAQPVVSATVTKTVLSAFEKTLTCFPKGPGAQNAIAAICVAHAQDITGAPFVGETICFMADFNASDIQFFNGIINGIDLGGTTQTTDPRGLRRICVITDANGNAAVEVFNSNPTVVDVTAFFLEEGILRSIKVPFPITQQVGPVNGTQPLAQTAPTPTGSNPTGTNPSGSNQPTGNNQPTTRPAVRYRVASLRLVRQTRTRAYALVRVVGPAGKVKLRLRIAARNQTRTALRSVRTGRVVKLPNLRTPRAAGRLRVSASVVS